MYFRPTGKFIFAAALIALTASTQTAYAQSAEVCDAYARSYAHTESRHGQILGGSAIGSLIGLGIGAAAGGAGLGAAIGAGVGFLGGGERRRKEADRMYDAAFTDCMAGRV